MEEKESTASGSPGGGNSATESPPPVSGGAVVERIFGGATPPTPAVESGASDSLGKKKRGRPRKYDADGNLSAAYKAAVAAKAAALSSPPGFSMSPSPPPSEYPAKRGRGKHSGSGNWQLPASLGGVLASTAGGDFMPHMVTVNTGEDVAAKILSFAQKGPQGVCVLSANGTVSNVAIRQPGSSGGILTYEGRFEILSLSGSFTVTDNGGIRSSRSGGLSVSLAGPDGRVVGGGIAGVLTAASPIQIVVGSFVPNGYKAQKRKYQRSENAMAPIRPCAPDTVTAASPISQAEPDVQVQSIFAPFQVQEQQSHGGSDYTGEKQMAFATSYAGATWNGSHQRPTLSPDINLSIPLE